MHRRFFRTFVNLVCFGLAVSSFAATAHAQSSVAGLYFAVLHHEATNHHQFAKITLRTVNPDGTLRISANVITYFGETSSNEFLTYEFPTVPYNLLTRQLSIRAEGNDISMTGYLRGDRIEGDWFSTMVGRVGTFVAQKIEWPTAPTDSSLVQSLSGQYRGGLDNTNPNSNLPERVSLGFVTTQDNSTTPPSIHISGFSRFYLGDFDSNEYVELKFTDIQFNFYNRFLTAKTDEYGLTFKGYMNEDGTFDGLLFSDALGQVGTVNLTKQ